MVVEVPSCLIIQAQALVILITFEWLIPYFIFSYSRHSKFLIVHEVQMVIFWKRKSPELAVWIRIIEIEGSWKLKLFWRNWNVSWVFRNRNHWLEINATVWEWLVL
jgi:hypothetical protein